jgi:sulfur-carrier protein adenylyltransferase/sulfurtransferase
MHSITPDMAYARQLAGARLIDIRSETERASGFASQSEHIAQIDLLTTLKRTQLGEPIVLICQSGIRSNASCLALEKEGFNAVQSVAGGSLAWLAAGLPWQTGENTEDLSARELQRYSRQLLLPEFGLAGQHKLKGARVLLIGAGGLGSPCALYLAAAGIGSLHIADGDRVDLSNLHRQILHDTPHLGEFKTASAKQRLLNLNPEIIVRELPMLTRENIDQQMQQIDVVIDGSDNFSTRFLVADACVNNRLPLVYGAVLRFDGQVSVFRGSHDLSGASPCYRCLFPAPPPAEFAPSCADAGVLGVLPGIIGSMQALEAIKLITGLGRSLNGRLMLFGALDNHWREVRVPRDANCPTCAPGTIVSYQEYTDYCATSFSTSS